VNSHGSGNKIQPFDAGMGATFSKLSDLYVELLSKVLPLRTFSRIQAKAPVLQALVAAIILRGQGSLLARVLRAAPFGWLLYLWAVLTRGHRGQSALYLMSHRLLDEPTVRTGGTAAPAFSAVRRAFQRNFALGLERGAQLVVYHEGEMVADLWGASSECAGAELPHGGRWAPYDPRTYGPDSMQVCFSTTKNTAAIVVALLVERGQLDYAAKVATYWPEFAENGKAAITLADVLRHESGLAMIHPPLSHAVCADLDALAARLAAHKPCGWDETSHACPDWAGKTSRRCYHGITRGFVLNEIVRRADPAGRTVGAILQQDIGAKLGGSGAQAGAFDFHVGLPAELEPRVAPLGMQDLGCVVAHHKAAHWGLKAAYPQSETQNPAVLKAFATPTSHLVRWISSLPGADVFQTEPKTPDALIPGPFDIGIMASNTRTSHSYESPSCNGVGSARALGRLAGAMANGGALADGTRVLAQESVAHAQAEPTLAFDTGIHGRTSFSQGGFNVWDSAQMGTAPVFDGFVGWGGLGGSLFVWHPQKKIGFAYTHNGPMRASPLGAKDPRCIRNMRAVLACLEKLG